jgi:hypothetical protein
METIWEDSAGVILFMGVIISSVCLRSKSFDGKKVSAYNQLIGNTPLIKLNILSEVTKRNIYLKVYSL